MILHFEIVIIHHLKHNLGRPETQVINNLKNVLLASHNYDEAYSRFPVQDNERYLDEDGRPFLSWRVHVLPMLDQQELYDQFHLDEPWDSEHNLELLEKMPAVYADPLGEVEDETLTRVVRFDVDADWAPFPGGVDGRIHDFLDGTSNTIMLGESYTDTYVKDGQQMDYWV